jgi:hypothetical protein
MVNTSEDKLVQEVNGCVKFKCPRYGSRDSAHFDVRTIAAREVEYYTLVPFSDFI